MSTPPSMPPTSGSGASNPMNQTLSQLDIETMAATDVARLAMGIAKDSIETSFTQIYQIYSRGHMDGRGYKASPDQPVLDHSIEKAYGTLPAGLNLPSELQEAFYQNLLDKLPVDIKLRFEEEMKLPPDKRTLAYQILETTFRATAQILAAIADGAIPAADGGLEAMRILQNMMMPIAGLKGSLALFDEISSSINSFLNSVGAGWKDHDALHGEMEQLTLAFALLSEVNQALGKTSDGQLSPADREKAAMAADLLRNVIKDADIKFTDNNLQILTSFAKVAAIYAEGLSLPFTGSASLYVGLNGATQGLLSKDLDDALSTLSDSLLPNGSPADKNFLKMQIIAAFIGASGASTSIIANAPAPKPSYMMAFPLAAVFFSDLFTSNSHLLSDTLIASIFGLIALIGSLPSLNLLQEPKEGEEKAYAWLEFSTALNLVFSSGIAETYFKEALAVSGATEKDEKIALPILTEMLRVFMILSAAREDGKKNPADLIEEHKYEIEKGIKSADALLSDQSGPCAIAIKQLKVSLQECEYDQFVELFYKILQMGNNDKDFNREFDVLKAIPGFINEVVNSKDFLKPDVGIIDVA